MARSTPAPDRITGLAGLPEWVVAIVGLLEAAAVLAIAAFVIGMSVALVLIAMTALR